MFSWCTSLRNITIPNGVDIIGSMAFYNCKNLTSITIPDSVTLIYNDSFQSCTGLLEVNISEGNTKYCSEEGILFDKTKTYILFYPLGKNDTSYVIPDSVTNINYYAFQDCATLTSITIPDSVTRIHNYAFQRCDNLKTVYYRGNQSNKNNIVIDTGNDVLGSAEWHYNSCIGTQLHTYDNECDVECNVCNEIRSIEHIYDNSCDAECNICFRKRQVQHEYENDCDYECDLCGELRAISDHFYDDDNDIICNVCGANRLTGATVNISGDIDGDAEVTVKDCAILMQYINGWGVDVILNAADVNDDGIINSKDYILVLRYLNGWNVEFK